MRKQIFFALSMTLSINAFAQIIFENGYFINDSNEKFECLIENKEWKNNPTMFEYKLSQDAITQKASIETVKEFAINGVSKYIRATVKIDKSGDNLNTMSSEKNPIFQEETLFLKVLVEGKASLFTYEMGNLRRFFYKTNDSEITQLVYKRYLINNKVAQNNFFRQQIFIDLNCPGTTHKNVEHISYHKKELEKLFVDFNDCTHSEYIKYELKQKNDFFNLSVRPGLNFSNLEITATSANIMETDFGNKTGFRFGIEAEFILPYNKNKWGVIIEPTFQYFNSERTTETYNISGGFIVSKVNYQSIELPIGVRHYFFLNDNSKIFADISFIFDFSNNSEINFSRIDGSILNTMNIESRSNFGLGVGYKLKEKYSIGVRYHTSREVLDRYIYWTSSYNTFSIIFGYTLF